MIKFEFESYESTPEDQYIKEIVMFKFTADNECWYVPYFHKSTKDGGMFWSTASVGVTKSGQKKYYDGFTLDSRFREKSIREFLDSRSWENRSVHQLSGSPHVITPSNASTTNYYSHGMAQQQAPASMDEVSLADLPF